MMKLRFSCSKCGKDKWVIDFDTVSRRHDIICAQCGTEDTIEDVFKRRSKNNARQTKKVDEKAEGQATE